MQLRSAGRGRDEQGVYTLTSQPDKRETVTDVLLSLFETHIRWYNHIVIRQGCGKG